MSSGKNTKPKFLKLLQMVVDVKFWPTGSFAGEYVLSEPIQEALFDCSVLNDHGISPSTTLRQARS